MKKLTWNIKRWVKSLWFRTTLYSLLGVLTAILAAYFKDIIPQHWSDYLNHGAVESILTILASSMLAVTTFSLNSLVSAYTSSSSGVTPRVVELLRNDATAINALSTFLGAFLFSIVGIVALALGLYKEQGRLLLFIALVIVVIFIVLTLIRWINYLTGLGRTGATIQTVEATSVKEIEIYLKNPHFDAEPWSIEENPLPADAKAIYSLHTGYVNFIDTEGIAHALKLSDASHKAKIYITALPGQFVSQNLAPIFHITGADETNCEKLIMHCQKAFTVNPNRTFNSDPRFGVIVMAEIATRGLSASVNDSGTVIDVVNRLINVVGTWTTLNTKTNEAKVLYSNIFVPKISLIDVFDDLFPAIARDSANLREVAIRLQKVLIALSINTSPTMASLAKYHAIEALKRNKAAMHFEHDYQAVERVHTKHWPDTAIE